MPSLKPLRISQLVDGIRSNDRAVLSRAITLAESTRAADRKKISLALERLLPFTGQSIRIGITGVPGVGKSTFIEVFGEYLAARGKKIGVLTVDPTSRKTKGSILGDKTRMERLSRNPNVFIRPSPTGLALGGVTLHTREAILLCEAAGYDVILIETVGVGQSEIQVRGMVDFFLLLVLAGAGDELQGIKKGIMEMADGIVITKADGENIKAANQAKADAMQALHFQPSRLSGWKTRVLTTSATEGKGITEVWEMILNFVRHCLSTGLLKHTRDHQVEEWLEESIEAKFKEQLKLPRIARRKAQLLRQIREGQLSPLDAATKLWNEMVKR